MTTCVDTEKMKKIELTKDELLHLLKEAYRNGFATYEMVEAGLEPYDSDGYARWVLLGLKLKLMGEIQPVSKDYPSMTKMYGFIYDKFKKRWVYDKFWYRRYIASHV